MPTHASHPQWSAHHLSARPLPSSSLHPDRAPMLAPEYRGITPRAALERRRRTYAAIQLAALKRVDARPVPVIVDATTDPAPRAWPWSLVSLVLVLAVIASCIAITHIR